MINKMYTKNDMNFEGISMQEGNKSSTLKLLAFMIITAIVLGLLIFTAGNFFAGESEDKDVPQITILPTSDNSAPTEILEPTEEVKDNLTPTNTPRLTVKPSPSVSLSSSTVKKQNLTVQVLNGSGIKGAAGKLSSALTSAGYTVSTGNADAFDYTGITINIKKSKSQSLDALKKVLSANDYLVTESTVTYPETSSSDAVIILGIEQE